MRQIEPTTAPSLKSLQALETAEFHSAREDCEWHDPEAPPKGVEFDSVINHARRWRLPACHR
jgi:hypothetical protein